MEMSGGQLGVFSAKARSATKVILVAALSLGLVPHSFANAQSSEPRLKSVDIPSGATEIFPAGIGQVIALGADRRTVDLVNLETDQKNRIFEADEQIYAVRTVNRRSQADTRPWDVELIHGKPGAYRVSYLEFDDNEFEVDTSELALSAIERPGLITLPFAERLIWDRRFDGRNVWLHGFKTKAFETFGKIPPTEFAAIGSERIVLGLHAGEQTMSLTNFRFGEVLETVYADFLDTYSPDTTAIVVSGSELGGTGAVLYADSRAGQSGVFALLSVTDSSNPRLRSPLISGLPDGYYDTQPRLATNADATIFVVGALSKARISIIRRATERLEEPVSIDLRFPIRDIDIMDIRSDTSFSELDEKLVMLHEDGTTITWFPLNELIRGRAPWVAPEDRPNKVDLTSLDRSTVSALQLALASLDYDVGPIDGLFGNRTAEAIKAFQNESSPNENEVTSGTADRNTVDNLLRVFESIETASIWEWEIPPGPLAAEQIVWIQRILGAEGYSVGSVDGQMGSSTLLALTRFQVASDIPASTDVDNGLDEATREALKTAARRIGEGGSGRDQRQIETYRAEFAEFIEREIPGFRSDRLLTMAPSNNRITSQCFGTNRLPPRELWPNIVPTAKAVDQVERSFGAIKITVAYRSSAYNACVGGATRSQHTVFNAIDVLPLRQQEEDIFGLAEEFRILRQNGVFTGGIGQYQSFIHVDARGTNADWNYSSSISRD